MARLYYYKEGLMDRNRIVNLIILVLGLFTLSVIVGCGTSGGAGVKWGGSEDVVYNDPPAAKRGPPPWAPAHGHRKKYQYRYYPDCSVYFDTGRSLYFYIEADAWVVSVSLPNDLNVRLGGHVIIDLDTDKPYTYYGEHKKKYPPGQAQKNKQKKWVHK
jgi:hypothetical protein